MEATASSSQIGLSARYRPALAVLHWLLALLIVGMLGVGFLALAPLADSDPDKMSILRWHMLGGILTLGTLVRLAVLRWTIGAPLRLTTGRGGLDVLSIVVHLGFYLVILLMASSGIATSILAGLPAIVFGGSQQSLPASLYQLPSLKAHAVLALLLIGMIGLHIAGVLYHQLVLKDRLLARMGIGGSSESA